MGMSIKEKISLCLLTLFSVVAILGVFKVEPTSDATIFFEKDAPELEQLEQFRNMYGSSDNALIMLSAGGKDLITEQFLSDIVDITASLEKLPHLDKIESIATIQYLKSTPFGPKVIPLIPEGQLDSSHIIDIREELNSSTLYRNYLFNEEFTALGINLTFDFSGVPQGSDQMVRDSLEQVLSQELTGSELKSHITGGIYINGAFTDAGLLDAKILTPIMVTVMLLLLFFFIRSLHEITALALAVFPVPLIVMGITGWFNIPFSPSTAVAPIIILAIGFATGIHVITAFHLALKETSGREEAMATALRNCRRAVLFTMLTTLIGFLTLNLSKTPPFRTMGNIAALGALLSTLFSLYLLPKQLMLTQGAREKRTLWSGEILFKIVSKHAGEIVVLSLLLAVVAIAGFSQLRSDDSFVNYFDSRFSFRRDSDKVLEQLTGIDYLQLSFDAPGGDILDSAYISRVNFVTRWCREQSEVRYVISLPKVMEELYFSMGGDTFPDRAVQEKIVQGLRKSNKGVSLISSDGSATQIFILFNRITSQELRSFALSCKTVVLGGATMPPGYVDSLVEMGSTSLLFANLSQSNSRAMGEGMLLSLLAITVTLFIILKKRRLGLISVVPNVVPLMISFGLWGIFVGKSGLGLSVVAPMSLGIIVDDTVHFLTHYRQFRTAGLSVAAALKSTYAELTSAVITTSCILSTAFLTMMMSGFQPSREMGIVTSVTILVALFADLFLLPSLLVIFDRD